MRGGKKEEEEEGEGRGRKEQARKEACGGRECGRKWRERDQREKRQREVEERGERAREGGGGGEANRGRLNNILGGVLTVPGRPRANSSPPPPPLHRSTRPTSGPSLPTPPRLSFAHAAAPRSRWAPWVGERGAEPSRGTSMDDNGRRVRVQPRAR